MTATLDKQHPPRKRRLRLTTVSQVRAYVAGVLERLENGELLDTEAKSRAYIAQIIVAVIKEHEITALAERLAKLEEVAK